MYTHALQIQGKKKSLKNSQCLKLQADNAFLHLSLLWDDFPWDLVVN